MAELKELVIPESKFKDNHAKIFTEMFVRGLWAHAANQGPISATPTEQLRSDLSWNFDRQQHRATKRDLEEKYK